MLMLNKLPETKDLSHIDTLLNKTSLKNDPLIIH